MAIQITLAKEGVEVGTAIVYGLPLHDPYDLDGSPKGLHTFAQAKQASVKLAEGRDAGRSGVYEWWKSAEGWESEPQRDGAFCPSFRGLSLMPDRSGTTYLRAHRLDAGGPDVSDWWCGPFSLWKARCNANRQTGSMD